MQLREIGGDQDKHVSYNIFFHFHNLHVCIIFCFILRNSFKFFIVNCWQDLWEYYNNLFFICILIYFSWLMCWSWRTISNSSIQQTCEWKTGFCSVSFWNLPNVLNSMCYTLHRWVSLRAIKRFVDTVEVRQKKPSFSKVSFPSCH